MDAKPKETNLFIGSAADVHRCVACDVRAPVGTLYITFELPLCEACALPSREVAAGLDGASQMQGLARLVARILRSWGRPADAPALVKPKAS